VPAPLLARALAAPDPHPTDPTTERILDAAAALFARAGLRGTTVEDVAREGGVARITVYRRFAQKDRLVDAVLLRECRRVLAELDEAMRAHPTMHERMVEGFVATMRLVRGHPLIGRLLAAEPETLLPYLTLRAGPGIAVARAFLAHRIRDGRPAEEDDGVEQTAELLVRLTLSFVLTPDSTIAARDDAALRTFARAHLLPLVPGLPIALHDGAD
jgi:AcrR family transcriptional regulator